MSAEVYQSFAGTPGSPDVASGQDLRATWSPDTRKSMDSEVRLIILM